MIAVQMPGQDPAQDAGPDAGPDVRRFEVLWSVDPRVVRDASRVAAALADEYAPGWRPGGLTGTDEDPPQASPDLARASELFNRMLGYLESTH
jgi:hypothetical protein